MRNNYETLCEDFLYPNSEWEYFWELDGNECALAPKYDNNNFVYCYYIDSEAVAIYKTIEDALNSVLYKGKTLKKALIETNFTFREIM